MPHVKIDFDEQPAIWIEAGVFYSWFESQRWTSLPFLVNGSEIVDILYTRLHLRYGIKKSTIRGTLLRLFQYLDSPISHVPGETRLRVATALAVLFNQDFNVGAWSNQYRRSRECYIILAHLANEWDSILLAGALREFWSDFGNSVKMYDPEYSQDWKRAREQLPGGWPNNGRIHGPDEATHRGRSTWRWPGDVLRYRGLSMPELKTRPSPGMQALVLRSSNPGWPSSPMPVGFPMANYFDDIDQLKWQQHAVNSKLDTMDQKLDLMLLGGY